uniref:Replication protein n=2 Tax=cellular organisms TaxID=131567 RepID=A0A914Z5G5_9BILA
MAQVDAGMRIARRQERPFLPSPGQFVAWCKQSGGALGVNVDQVIAEYWEWRNRSFEFISSEQFPWSQPVMYHICVELRHRSTERQLTHGELAREAGDLLDMWERRVTEGGGAKNNVSFDSGNAYAAQLREVTPLYTAPPAPVSVPAAMEIDDDFDSAFEHGKAVGWNAYRAAMLQAEPVSNSDELPLDYLQGHKDGLEWAAQLAEANHPQTGDWLYDDQIELARAIRKGPDMPTVQGGNSPVIPDGWVMVPVELTPDMRAAWDSAPYTDDDDNDMQAAYRAMIAVAPQWKVK